MAQAVVSAIINKLGDLLIQQVDFLVGVKGQVEDLRRELLWIQSFLQDADSRQDESSVVRNWVSEIRDAAYDIEDIIDTYILKVADEDVLDHPPRRRRFLGYLKKYALISQKGANLYCIGKEVEDVKSRIRQTGQAMQNYGIIDFGSRGGDRMKPSSKEIFQQPMEGQGENNLVKILSSYDSLPYRLKECFLYIGLFPADHEIEVDTLVRLWVAEGFIQCGRDETMEDVARDCWNELINRRMLTVVEQDDLGEVLSCRIHDLLRDICISIGQEEKFLDYYVGASSSSTSTTGIVCKSRRYAIHSSGIERFEFSNLSHSHLRTLLLFNPNSESLQQQQLDSISNIKLLKVLDLSNVNFQGKRLPDSFGKLIHLKYLRLKNAKAKLPSSIGSLRSLQTLDLEGSDCHWSDIAKGSLSKLTQLKDLILSERYWDGLDREVDLPRIDTLTKLQTLWIMDALVWKQNETTNLINLRELHIRNIGASDVQSVLSSIGQLDKIKILSLQLSEVGSPEYAFPMLVHLSHCHHLRDLTLAGKIERLPELPPTSRLTELFLEYSRLGPEAMAILENMPYLILLTLSENSIMGKKIVCSAHGFTQLQVVSIVGLETVEWEIKDGALPKLDRLTIWGCSNLKRIPMGLRFVATLQVLSLIGMPQEFRDRFDRGEYADEIRHIHSIEPDWIKR